MIARLLQSLRQFASTLFTESLSPARAAAAVFVGIFIAHVPIYGFQAVAAVGLAVVLGLNKPLTLAATFINNPLLQPFLVFLSVEIGHFLLRGSFVRLALSDLTFENFQAEFSAWLVGTLTLGALLGGVAALGTFVVLHLRASVDQRRREHARFVNRLFAECPPGDRKFVKWKMRLDRIFELLATEDLGSGRAVDLGCGYAIALGFAAFRDRSRLLIGCDLNARRIAAARKAFANMNAELSVTDVRSFDVREAGLVLILDVLQYLSAHEQLELLARCCSALVPGGKLIFRVPDRRRALSSWLSLGFDRLVFLVDRTGLKPTVLPAAEYRRALSEAGLRVEERRFRNRLPIAHVLFVAEKAADPSVRP